MLINRYDLFLPGYALLGEYHYSGLTGRMLHDRLADGFFTDPLPSGFALGLPANDYEPGAPTFFFETLYLGPGYGEVYDFGQYADVLDLRGSDLLVFSDRASCCYPERTFGPPPRRLGNPGPQRGHVVPFHRTGCRQSRRK